MIKYVGRPMPNVTIAKGKKESLGGMLVIPKIWIHVSMMSKHW
jgi:hypothetical protein